MATIYPGGRALRYSTVAIWLHWLIAAFLMFNLATGLAFPRMSDAAFGALVPYHISSGISVLALTVLRIVWRLTHRPPPMLTMPAWQRLLAGTVYLLFYVGMLAAPLTGWAMSSAYAPKATPPAIAKPVAPGVAPAPKPAKHQTMIWGVLPLPKIAPIVAIGNGPDGPAKLHETHEQFEQLHGTIGWILLALLVLHIMGAVKHQFVDRRRELARMGIG